MSDWSEVITWLIGGGTVAAFLRQVGVDAVVWSRMEETAQSMEQDDLDEGGREPSIEVTDVYIYCVRIQASRQDIGSRTHYDKRKSSWEDIAVLLYTLIPSLRQLSSTKTFP